MFNKVINKVNSNEGYFVEFGIKDENVFSVIEKGERIIKFLNLKKFDYSALIPEKKAVKFVFKSKKERNAFAKDANRIIDWSYMCQNCF